MNMDSAPQLPPDLEEIVIKHFDELAAHKELLYEPSEPEVFKDNGFQFELRIVPILMEKPIAPPSDPGRVKPGGPFLNPTPEETITLVGSSHRLLLNKYCIYRPMLLLTPIQYVQQKSDLERSDISAAWAVIQTLKTPQVVIYNCGVNAGSSQGHKHMQVFPQPDPKYIELFPSKETSARVIKLDIPNVPFKHFVLTIPPEATADEVFESSMQLLKETRKALVDAGQENDYNMAMAMKWIALIPRSGAEWGGPFGANAQGMLGLVSVRDQDEKDR